MNVRSVILECRLSTRWYFWSLNRATEPRKQPILFMSIFKPGHLKIVLSNMKWLTRAQAALRDGGEPPPSLTEAEREHRKL